MATRILIIDDSVEFRAGLRRLLETRTDWVVCGEAASGREGIEKNVELRPCMIITDQSMPGMSGIETAQEILKDSPKVLILLLTLYLTRQLWEEAHRVGIRATFSKTATGRLLEDIDALLREQARS